MGAAILCPADCVGDVIKRAKHAWQAYQSNTSRTGFHLLFVKKEQSNTGVPCEVKIRSKKKKKATRVIIILMEQANEAFR